MFGRFSVPALRRSPALRTLRQISTTHQPYEIFDYRLKKLQRERAASLPNARQYDYLKDEIGERLADRLLVRR